LAEFWPATARQKTLIEALKNSGNLQCLDKLDIYGKNYSTSFYGSDSFTDHRRFEIILEPCHSYAEHMGKTNPPECYIKDNYTEGELAEEKKRLLEYLGIPQMQTILN
jgi:hypothetical protein